MIFLSRSQSLSLPDFKEAQFYLINLQVIQDAEVENAQELLDAESLSRANRHIFREDQHRAILVHAFLRFHLENLIKQKASEIKILRDAVGKPYIMGTPIHFNLSHTKQYALLAFHSHCPIGVDIEQVQNISDLLNVADRFMHPSEKSQMSHSTDPHDYFFSLWCAKEAFLKATGISFDQLPDWCLNDNLSHDTTLFTSINHKIYVYKDIVESHKLAVCQSCF